MTVDDITGHSLKPHPASLFPVPLMTAAVSEAPPKSVTTPIRNLRFDPANRTLSWDLTPGTDITTQPLCSKGRDIIVWVRGGAWQWAGLADSHQGAGLGWVLDLHPVSYPGHAHFLLSVTLGPVH